MSAQAIDAWLEQVRSNSAVYSAFYSSRTTDDIITWDELLDELLNNEASERSHGLLITGPEGCGRHTILTETVGKVLEAGYETIFLTGSQLQEDAGNQQEICARMEALLDGFRSEEEGLCLILDEMDEMPFRMPVLRILERCLCQAQVEKVRKGEASWAFFLILLQDENAPLPPVLRSMLQVCRVQYPNRIRRKNFLQGHLAERYKQLPEDLLLGQTEGFTYHQLSNLAGILGAAAYIQRGTLPDSITEELIDGQRLDAQQAERMERLEQTVKAAFWEKLTHTLEELPELLSHLPQNTVVQTQGTTVEATQPTEDLPKEQTVDVEAERQKIEQESGSEFICNYFEGIVGKDEIERVLTQEA